MKNAKKTQTTLTVHIQLVSGKAVCTHVAECIALNFDEDCSFRLDCQRESPQRYLFYLQNSAATEGSPQIFTI